MKSQRIVITYVLFSLLALSVASVLAVESEPNNLPENSIQTGNNSAIDSLMSFSRLYGTPLTRERMREVLPEKEARYVFQDIFNAGVKLGLPMQEKHLTLEEIRQRGGPEILHLSNPDEIVVLAAMGTHSALIYEQGQAAIIDNQDLARRFSGDGIVLINKVVTQPSLQVDEAIRNIEVTSLGGSSEMTQKINITNTGKENLNLAIEAISCGCTGAELSSKSIFPGQSAWLTVKMHPSGVATNVVTVTVRTTDPLWPRVVIGLEAILPKMPIRPPERLIISGEKGHPTQEMLPIILPNNVSILKAVASQHFVDAMEVGMQPANGRIVHYIQVSFTNKTPDGPFRDEIVIDLRNAEIQQVRVPVEGMLNSEITLEPRMVILGAVSSGSTIKRSVIIQSPTGQSFALKSLECSNPLVKVKFSPDVMAARQEINLEIKIAGPPRSVIQCRIKLILSHERELNLDVLGTIAATSSPATITHDN